MTALLFVGDGRRDKVTVPRIVERILGVQINERFRPWARLHSRATKGYRRKLLYAIRQARDLELVGLVATVDADKDRPGRKLAQLKEAREEDRMSSSPTPTALGEAVPHGEAWLLDDPVAVRSAFGLSSDTRIPTVRKTKNPKDTLERLKRQGKYAERRILDLLADVAKVLEVSRCIHAQETGFKGLVDDVEAECRKLVKAV